MKRCKKCRTLRPNNRFYQWRKTCILCYNQRPSYNLPPGVIKLPDPAMTLEEIAAELGVTKQRVQQILHQALWKLWKLCLEDRTQL